MPFVGWWASAAGVFGGLRARADSVEIMTSSSAGDAAAALNFFTADTGQFTGTAVAEAEGFADLAGRAARPALG